MAHTQTADLSSFAIGDICYVSGSVSLKSDSAKRYIFTIRDIFEWSTSNIRTYEYQSATHYIVTLTLTASQLTLGYSYGSITNQTPISAGLAIYKKTDFAWQPAQKAYKKQNGVWVEITDMSQVFDPNVSYQKAEQ